MKQEHRTERHESQTELEQKNGSAPGETLEKKNRCFRQLNGNARYN